MLFSPENAVKIVQIGFGMHFKTMAKIYNMIFNEIKSNEETYKTTSTITLNDVKLTEISEKIKTLNGVATNLVKIINNMGRNLTLADGLYLKKAADILYTMTTAGDYANVENAVRIINIISSSPDSLQNVAFILNTLATGDTMAKANTAVNILAKASYQVEILSLLRVFNYNTIENNFRKRITISN